MLAEAIDLELNGLNSYSLLDPSIDSNGLNVLLYGQKGRIGESVISSVYSYGVGGRQHITYTVNGTNDNDAYLTGGDSGGPSFVVGNNDQLLLTGTVYSGYTSNATEIVQRYEYVPHYIEAIQNAIPEISITTSPVPEPSSSFLLCLGLAFLTQRRRNHPNITTNQ